MYRTVINTIIEIMQYCATCVSSNRHCVMLSDRPEFWEVINLLDVDLSIATDCICWECECIFKRIGRFKTQILQSQELIRNCPKLLNSTSESTKKMQLESLSQLSSATKNAYDNIYIESENEIKFNFTTAKKQSVNEYLGFDVVDNLDNEAIDVKYENSTNIKNETTTERNNMAKLTVKKLYVDIKQGFKNKMATDKNEVTEISVEEKQYDYEVVKHIKFSKDEQMFNVTAMTIEEVFKMRDMDRQGTRYQKCPYKCDKCILGYFVENKFKEHLKLHDASLDKNEKLQKCPICELRCRRGENYETHYDRHFRRYTCRSCDYTHHKLRRMQLHQTKEHNDRVFQCKICQETFVLPRALRYHYDTTHREKPKCDVCGKVCSTKSSLKIHMLVHTGAPRVACGACGRRVRAGCLRAHARTHARAHDAPDARYCAECDRRFASRLLYARHLALSRTHRRDDQLEHACEQCPARFARKYELQLHVSAKHLKAYPYKCDVCGKAFTRKSRVKQHIMEKHEGKAQTKDKICVYCGKAFKTNAVLKNHVRIHTGERPFACAHCPAAFAQRSTLRTHAKALHKHLNT